MSETKHNDSEAKRKQQQAVAAAAHKLAAKPAGPKPAPPKAAAKPGQAPLPPKLAAAAKMAPPPNQVRAAQMALPPNQQKAAKMALPPNQQAARRMLAAKVGPQTNPSALKLPTTAPKPEKKEGGGLFGWLSSGYEKAKQAGSNIVSAAKKNIETAVAVATDPKKRAEFVKGVQDKAKTLITTVTDPKKRAEAITKLYNTLPKPVKALVQIGGKVLDAGKKTLQKTVQAVKDGLKVAKKVGGQLVDVTKKGVAAAAGKIRQAVNSPGFKKFLDGFKAAGIQALKIGTTIVVGGLVIAGATALTVATGGLAGLPLVMALFASGAISGAAGQMIENKLTGKKLGEGISAKSLFVDGALGVLMGPASKVVGGLAKGIARPVLKGAGALGRWIAPGVGKVLKPLAGMAGKALNPLAKLTGKGLTKLGLDPASAAGKAKLGQLGANGLGKLVSAGKWIQGGGLKQAGMKVSKWLGNTRGGKLADGIAGRLAGGLGKVGSGLAKVGKGIGSGMGKMTNLAGRGLSKLEQKALNSRLLGPSMRVATRAGRAVVGGVKSRMLNVSSVVKGGLTRSKDAVRGGLKRLGQGVVNTSGRTELRLREFINAKMKRQISTNSADFATTRMFAGVSRSAANIRAYAGNVGKDIRAEVLEQWRSMGGVQNAARTAERVEAVKKVDQSVARAIEKHEQAAIRTEIKAKAREIAQRDGLSMTQARKVAAGKVIPAEVRKKAAGTLSPKLAQKVGNIYNAKVLPGEMGYEPGSGLVTRLPGMVAAGANSMLTDTGRRLGKLGNDFKTKGLAEMGSTALGNFSEEASKPFMFGATDKLRSNQSNSISIQDGWNKTRKESLNAGIISLTDSNPHTFTMQSGLLAPMERVAKTYLQAEGNMQTMYGTYHGDDLKEKTEELTKEREEREHAAEHDIEHHGAATSEHPGESEHP